jgi:choline dehydrogenase-like flavoprotein
MREATVLAALARGVVQDGDGPLLAERALQALGMVPSRADRARLLATLRQLDTRLGALALTGRASPVSSLAPEQAEAVVRRWRTSPVALLRRLAGVVVAAALVSEYAFEGPAWERIGYPGPLGPPPDEPRRLEPLTLERDESLTCDVVVVGSGAGGGVVAGELAARGLDVIVLEKGGYLAERDFTHLEPDALARLYLYGMTLTTEDMGCRIVAGSTLGGGTVVNYTTSFGTPLPVREEWARISGIDAFRSGELEWSLAAVADRIGVNSESSLPGRRDLLMQEGLVKLGWHCDTMPRNVRGCSQDANCGYCGFGCRLGAKQSTMRTYLQDAAGNGARLVIGADVRRVTIDDGRATGVEAVSGPHRLRVSARAVVAAGGSIETPALLLRSGLGGQVGHHLRLHPGTAVWGVFDDEVRMWEGTTQASFSKELRDVDDGYGPLLETVPVHPGSGSGALPWVSAAQHRAMMDRFTHLSHCAVLGRDAGAGRVRVDGDGGPRLTYTLRADDERRIAAGVEAAGRVLVAAGATEIFSSHPSRPTYRPDGSEPFERWAEATRAAGYRSGRLTFYSFHQMGSCRMHADPAEGPVGADNETHEVRSLFVADASLFPTATGVNPMLSVMGLAHRAAGKIADKLA